MASFSGAISSSIPLDRSRTTFLRKTYLHLAGAIVGLVAFEVALFSSGAALAISEFMLSGSWLLILGGFMVVGWMARKVAHSSASAPMQYFALAGYVVAQGLLLAPMLMLAAWKAGGGVIESAAAVTLFGFAGLTAIVFTSKKDFSFMAMILRWGGFCALALIAAAAIFGFHLGTLFSVAMIALAGGGILFDTSNVLHHYPQDRHVAASLELFASVALMFWYVLRLFTSSRN